MAEAHIAVFGLETISKGIVMQVCRGQLVQEWAHDMEKLMEMAVNPAIRCILCGPPPTGVALTEVAQFLRMQYPDAALFYLTTARAGFNPKIFIKNGFSDAFLVPFESSTLEMAFKAEIAKFGEGNVKQFKTVKIVDLQPGQAMDFDTFLHLPTNGKRIKYTAAGDPIDPERAKKLAQHNSTMQIDMEDKQKFYKFTADQLKKLGSNETMSATEKRDRMEASVRALVSDLFQDNTSDQSFEKGKAVLADCQEIVKAYIMNSVGGNDNKWYDKLIALSQSENSAYTHSSNVATYASLFSMSLGIGNPEHLAMAGLLHDIGMSEVPAAILLKKPADWTPEEKTAYEKHPKASISLIQARKMVVPEIVLKIITQHHERFDGKGYPEQLRGTRIRPDAQILSIADEFCYLTQASADGKPGLTPLQAMKKIYDSIPSGEVGHQFDPALVRRLYEIFKPST